MFDLKLNSVIQTLVDHELDRKTPVEILDNGNYQRPGVYLPIFLGVHDVKSDKYKYEQLMMLFVGNTSVFYTTKYNLDIKKISNKSWINTSNHDSCWRSDGFAFLHEIQMKMCKNVNPNIAPVKLYTEAKLSIGNSYPIKHCIVTFKNDTVCKYGYKIVNIGHYKR